MFLTWTTIAYENRVLEYNNSTDYMHRLFTPVLFHDVFMSGLFSTAQTTIFVKILDQDGTQLIGESIAARHPNEIIATSFGQENTVVLPMLRAERALVAARRGILF